MGSLALTECAPTRPVGRDRPFHQIGCCLMGSKPNSISRSRACFTTVDGKSIRKLHTTFSTARSSWRSILQAKQTLRRRVHRVPHAEFPPVAVGQVVTKIPGHRVADFVALHTNALELVMDCLLFPGPHQPRRREGSEVRAMVAGTARSAAVGSGSSSARISGPSTIRRRRSSCLA